ncbi:hypothetical protein [Croceibacter atlanticus]|uniref:class I SAM-dependent methyltransferase n=1 Tax=Croceibacter atlanticus TaxID=313588 RepID=UPI0030D77C37|tara:strand:+ start:47636 stop:49078 length:1443 start_codon:yes stop_codon:yes gene_type:complete
MDFLDDYKIALQNTAQLYSFINKRMDELFDYYSLSNFEVLEQDRLFFRSLSTFESITGLNFLLSKNEAYLNLLLSTAVRLNEPFIFEHFLNLLNLKGLEQSKIIRASALFMNCRNAIQLIDTYDTMLIFLEQAFLTETDFKKEPLVVLLNYFATAINHFGEFNERRLIEVRSLIIASFEEEQITFLKDSILEEVIDLDISFENQPHKALQLIIDSYLVKDPIPETFAPGFIIESGTAYADLIKANSYSMFEIWQLNRDFYNQIGETNPIFRSLGRGTAVLTTEDQLIVYMSQLGKMHFAKLKDAFKGLPNNLSDIHLFDWGCGQAPASKMFLDRFGVENISSVTLIEPSLAALKRASLHISSDTQNITTINKDFDSLIPDDFKGHTELTDITVHIFSNVIDMENFQLHKIIDLLRKKNNGITYYIIVSPYINSARVQRIETFVEEICEDTASELMFTDTKRSGTWNLSWSKVIRVFKTLS